MYTLPLDLWHHAVQITHQAPLGLSTVSTVASMRTSSWLVWRSVRTAHASASDSTMLLASVATNVVATAVSPAGQAERILQQQAPASATLCPLGEQRGGSSLWAQVPPGVRPLCVRVGGFPTWGVPYEHRASGGCLPGAELRVSQGMRPQ